VAVSYETVAATAAPPKSRTSSVPVPMVAASIASLKVTVTLAVADTPVAPADGVVAVIVGGVVSGPAVTGVVMSVWI
jgi:hypothetical protein